MAAKTAPTIADDSSRPLPRGYGSMRDVPFEIDPRIDLTQPIYEQVLKLRELDGEAGSVPQ